MNVNGQQFAPPPQGHTGPGYASGYASGYAAVNADQYGPPYDAQSPGSGGSPASPQSPYSDSPVDSPQQGEGSGAEDQFMDKDYTEFTEAAGKTSGSASPVRKVDPDSGVSARRPTDFVCVLLFLVYIIGMLIFLAIVKSTSIDGRAYSDVRRLTHGMDYEARLCGVDAGVEAKKYIFWCRDDPSQTDFSIASTLNLKHPVCVEECPRTAAGSQLGPSKVECMRRPQGQGPPPENAIQPVPNIPGGQFGTVENYFLMFREETVYATTYDSELLAGRYCVPTNETLKADVLAITGPLGLVERVQKGIGSFQDCWLIVFLAVVVAVIVSLAYITVLGSLKDVGMIVVCACLITVSVALLLVSLFFFSSFCYGTPLFSKQQYMELNVFYARASDTQALIASMVCGSIFLLLSFGALSFYTNVNGSESKIENLLEAAWSALIRMKSLFFIPVILALAKFFVMWLICYNFMSLCAVGMYDDYRIVVEGELFAGMSKNFYFDPWMWWGILVYVVGGFWLLEIFTSLGQFVISWCAVIYYFESKDDENEKVDPPRRVAWKGLLIALRYHAGSILLGAVGIWFFRIPRMVAWIWSESLPHEESSCGFTALNLCWKPIGRCFDCCAGKKSARKKTAEKWQSGDSIIQQWSKDAYQDVTIRTTHFLQAKEKAQKYINSQKDVKKLTGECRPCTFVGVVVAGIAGFFVCYLAISFTGMYNDPSKPTFIQDPLMVASMAFFLCGHIAYDFCALLDHMADCLLYCFAYNKKHNKKTIDRFVPEEIQDLIGKEEIEHTKKPAQPHTGKAPPDMFLATWKKKMDHTLEGWRQGGDPHASH